MFLIDHGDKPSFGTDTPFFVDDPLSNLLISKTPPPLMLTIDRVSMDPKQLERYIWAV